MHGGATEATPATPPPGAYANSCVAREAMFQYFSRTRGTPGRIIRLNYAIDMRYGVLHDVATRVLNGQDHQSRHRPRERDLAGRRQRHGAARARPLHGAVEPAQCQRSGDRQRPLARAGVRRNASARRRCSPASRRPTAGWSTPREAMRLFGYPRVPLARLDRLDRGLGRARPAEPRQGHPLRYARWPVLTCARHRALLRPADLDDADALVREAGWNQIAADWRIFLELGTVYAERDERRPRDRDRRDAAVSAASPGSAWCWSRASIAAAGSATRLHAPLRSTISPRAGVVPVLDATPDGRDGLSRARLRGRVGLSPPDAARARAAAGGPRRPPPASSFAPIADAVWPAALRLSTRPRSAPTAARVLARLRGRLPAAELVARARRPRRRLPARPRRAHLRASRAAGRRGRCDRAARCWRARSTALDGPIYIDLADAKTGDSRLARSARLRAAAAAHPHAATAAAQRFDDAARTFAVVGPGVRVSYATLMIAPAPLGERAQTQHPALGKMR